MTTSSIFHQSASGSSHESRSPWNGEQQQQQQQQQHQEVSINDHESSGCENGPQLCFIITTTTEHANAASIVANNAFPAFPLLAIDADCPSRSSFPASAALAHSPLAPLPAVSPAAEAGSVQQGRGLASSINSSSSEEDNDQQGCSFDALAGPPAPNADILSMSFTSFKLQVPQFEALVGDVGKKLQTRKQRRFAQRQVSLAAAAVPSVGIRIAMDPSVHPSAHMHLSPPMVLQLQQQQQCFFTPLPPPPPPPPPPAVANASFTQGFVTVELLGGGTAVQRVLLPSPANGFQQHQHQQQQQQQQQPMPHHYHHQHQQLYPQHPQQHLQQQQQQQQSLMYVPMLPQPYPQPYQPSLVYAPLGGGMVMMVQPQQQPVLYYMM